MRLWVTIIWTNLYQTRQQSVLDAVKNAVMFENLEVLCFVEEVLVRILATHGVGTHLSLGHLLSDLAGGCVTVSYASRLYENAENVPLLLPRMKL
jgi:hypothetical protein